MLTEQLTADAAALHQAILDHGGEVSLFFCGKELGWEHRRIARAMEELVAAGIIDPAAVVLPKPLKQRKTYDFPEIQAILADFPALCPGGTRRRTRRRPPPAHGGSQRPDGAVRLPRPVSGGTGAADGPVLRRSHPPGRGAPHGPAHRKTGPGMGPSGRALPGGRRGRDPADGPAGTDGGGGPPSAAAGPGRANPVG